MFLNLTKLKQEDINSKNFTNFKSLQIKHMYNYYSDIFQDNCSLFYDEDEDFLNDKSTSNVDKYNSYLQPLNDQISLIQHDQPLQSSNQDIELKKLLNMTEFKSIDIILFSRQLLENKINNSKTNDIKNGELDKNDQSDITDTNMNAFVILTLQERDKNIPAFVNYKKNQLKTKHNFTNQQLPEFLLQKNQDMFSKSELDKSNNAIDQKGLNFYFNINDRNATHILMSIDQANIVIYYQGDQFLIKSDEQDQANSGDQFVSSNIPLNALYVQIKIREFNEIRFIGFFKSKFFNLNFNKSIQDSLHISFQDQCQNTKVMAQMFGIDYKQVDDNRIPFIMQHSQDQNNPDCNEIIQNCIQDFTEPFSSDENEFILCLHPKLLEGIKFDANIQKMYILITKKSAKSIVKVKSKDFLKSPTELAESNTNQFIGKQLLKRTSVKNVRDELMDENCQSMQHLIRHMNQEKQRNSDFLIEIEQNQKFIKLFFDLPIRDIQNVSVFKLDNEYANEFWQKDQNKLDMFLLTSLKFQDPKHIYKIDGINFWLMDGESKYILSENLQKLSNFKDSGRSELIMNEFSRLVITNFEEQQNLIKDINQKDQISTLFVHQENSLLQIEENFNISDAQTISGVSSIDAMKSKKQPQISDPDQQQVRLIGLVFLYYLRYIALDFKFNKEQLRLYFKGVDKFSHPIKLNQRNLTNPIVQNFINDLPLFYIFTLYQFCNFVMDRRIDWIQSQQFTDSEGKNEDQAIQVNIEKGFALVNSPASQLYPLPAILQFNDQIKAELTQDDLENLNSMTQESVQNQLNGQINEETGVLCSQLLNEKYQNDLIQNTQFKLFGQSQEVRSHVINFIREISLTEAYTFELQNQRLINITNNLKMKNDLVLVRQTRYMDSFEVSKNFYLMQKEEDLKFNGLQFTENEVVNYKVENKDHIEGSSILTTNIKSVNRTVNFEEYLLGLYNNQEDTIIQDFEFIRDIIDYVTQKYLIFPQTVQVQSQVLSIIIQISMIQTQLGNLDPISISESVVDLQISTISTSLLMQIGCYITLFFEILFLSKTILEIIFTNLLTNYNEGLDQWQTLVDIIFIKTIMSEKILSVTKQLTTGQTCQTIIDNLSNEIVLNSSASQVLIISCFISIFNLVNFLSQFKSTQKLIITLIEIFKDMFWTLFISFTLILSLTCAIFGIECLKVYLINADDLLDFTTNLALVKSWYQPYNLNINSFQAVLYQSVGLALLADTSIFDEYEYLIGLISEFDVVSNLSNSEKALLSGIKRIAELQMLWQGIVVVVIIAQIVILLNFVIAIMSDSQSKVSEAFNTQTQRLKASQMVEWHWLLWLQFRAMTEEERWIRPWKVCLQNPADEGEEEEWAGQTDLLKKYIDERVRKLGTNLNTIQKGHLHLERRIDDLKQAIDLKLDSIIKSMQEVKNK